MGFDNKYPYTDFHELNLDWLLEKVKGIDDRFVAIEDAVAALREDLDIQTGRIDAALDAITFIQNHYPAMIASQYDENRQYDPGEIAIYDNELYIALPGETPGPWNGNYWNKTSLGDELGTIIIKVNDIILPDLTNINNVLAQYSTLFDDIVETYLPGSTYVKNQMVKYEDHIYRVMVASTNNPPTDLTDWDPETLANIVTDLLNFWDKIIPEYDETATYNVPDYVIYQGNVYTCNGSNVTGAWDDSKWNPVILTDDIASRLAFMYGTFSTLFGWFASYDDTATYNKGDVVNYNGTLYECLYDGVTGAWDVSKWQMQKVTDAMTDVNTYYKNFPVKTLIGNHVVINDATDAPLKSAVVSIPVAGVSSLYVNRTNKNLLTYTLSQLKQRNTVGTWTNNVYERDGISFTVLTDLDGETVTGIDVNGTASVNTSMTLNRNTDTLPVNTKIIFNGSTFNSSNSTFRTQININGSTFTVSTAGDDRIGITPASITSFDSYIVVFAGVTANHEVFKPMARTEGSSDFVPPKRNIYTVNFGSVISGGYYDFVSGKGEDGSYNPIIGTPNNIIMNTGINNIWTDGDDAEIIYHYSEQSVDYTPDDRVVVIGTYSGKRVLQINHFEQNVSLDGSLKSFNILPANAILINAWAYGKGNDDGTMANMNPWWSTTAGDLCIMASSWASNTTADIWMYAQYVE